MDVQAGQQQPAQPPAVSRTRGLVSGPDESGHRRVTPGPPAVASPADVDHEGSLGTGQEPFTVGPREQACTVTRGRPYQHNDNAHNEQRNGDWVRKHAFRHRYETDAELALLNQLWALVMARKNPAACVKATGWTQTSAGRKKRIYDKPRTPYQRLLDTGILDDTTRARLETEHATLNPARITTRINHIQTQLIDLAKNRTLGTRPAA